MRESFIDFVEKYDNKWEGKNKFTRKELQDYLNGINPNPTIAKMKELYNSGQTGKLIDFLQSSSTTIDERYDTSARGDSETIEQYERILSLLRPQKEKLEEAIENEDNKIMRDMYGKVLQNVNKMINEYESDIKRIKSRGNI